MTTRPPPLLVGSSLAQRVVAAKRLVAVRRATINPKITFAGIVALIETFCTNPANKATGCVGSMGSHYYFRLDQSGLSLIPADATMLATQLQLVGLTQSHKDGPLVPGEFRFLKFCEETRIDGTQMLRRTCDEIGDWTTVVYICLD